MYFVRYQPLKDKLRDRTLGDREALPYVVLFYALIAAALFPMTWEGNAWDYASWGGSIAAGVFGPIHVYRCNGGRNGHDFVQKIFVLGWVVAFRCLLVFIPLMGVVMVAGVLGGWITEETGWIEFALMLGFEVVYFQRLGRHITDTRAARAGGVSEVPL